MSVQEQELRKNYIGILSYRIEDHRAVESPPKSDRVVKKYFLGLIDAVLKRHGDAR
jgi:hypothetical protein